MLFNSFTFLIFFPVVLFIYYRLTLHAQNVWLLIASYVFYGWWDYRFLSLILISTIVDYGIGLTLYNTDDARRRKVLVAISLAVNLGILGLFKYFGFFVDSAAALLQLFDFHPNLPLLKVVLPVGISFYTFQTLSYTLDIYRGNLEPTRHFGNFALFVAYFPQLVAGPIERARNLWQYVAFASADPIVAGDTNGFGDVFVYEIQTGVITRVSVDSAGMEGNFGSSFPSLSSDGCFVG